MLKNNLLFNVKRALCFCLLILALYSCNEHSKTDAACKEKFKRARKMVYTYPAPPPNQQTLVSALQLVNETLMCDSVRKAAVELKLTLLITMGKYSEGISFVDSLEGSDFTFYYKKKLMSKHLQALDYESKKDTVKRNLIYQEIISDLEQYINYEDVPDKAFDEMFIDLYILKEKFIDSSQINKEVDSLKKRYPNKEAFFDFLKK